MAKVKIAITGGIGSGKSMVARLLRESGYTVVDCDKIAGQITKRRKILKTLKRQLPYSVKGKIFLRYDRQAVAKHVFGDQAELKKLNAITHPAIMNQVIKGMKRAKGQIAFAEVPLLFEGGFENLFDGVIVVKRDISTRIASVMERSNLTKEQVENRIKNQVDYENITKNTHTLLYEIKNDSDIPTLFKNLKGVLIEIEKTIKQR